MANRLGPISSNFISCTKRSISSPTRAVATTLRAAPPPSGHHSQVDHHQSTRAGMMKPTIRSGHGSLQSPESPTPAVGGGQTGLIELTRSTQPVKPPKLRQQLFPTLMPPKRMFAVVVAPSKAPQTASHKFFLADSPPPSIGAVLTDEKGPTLIFSDEEIQALTTPFRLALVGKFSHGKPQFRHLHRLIAGLGVKGAFTVRFPLRIFKWTPTFTPAQESSLIPIWDALFAVANMIGTPLQIDDCTFSQSKLSKARIRIEIDLTKPVVEGFNLQINGVTIHQKVEYEQLPKYCNLCKHVGHDDLECYTMGNASRPPPRAKKSKGKDTMGTKEQVVTEKAKAFERGECSKSRYSTNLSNDNVDSGKHGEHDEHDDNIVMNDEHVDITCEVDKMGEETVKHIVETDLPSDNLVVGDVYFSIGRVEIQKRKKRINLQQASKLFRSLKFFGMTARPLKEWDDTDESEGEDDDVNPGSPRSLKIQDPIGLLNHNPAETEEGERFLVPSPTPPRKNRHRCTHWAIATT
ncbi:UNVERIFIED_CONTAM: hypothetical protein Sindi_2667200 [Sesamum indicum]